MSTETASSSDLYQRAVAAYDAGELAEAERLCAEIRQHEAEHFDAARLLARVQCRLGRHREALASYDMALKIRPDDAEVLNRRGDVLRQLNRLEEALASCERAIAISPGMAEAYNNRGLILEDLRRLPEALESLGKAQELAPAYAQAQWNEAALRLLTGEFLRGWAKYEWRWKCDGRAPWRFSQPQWDGLASLYDKTILVHGQGRLSEAIMFCRYVPQLAARGARIILDVPEPLRAVMKTVVGGGRVLSEGEEPPRFDLHCPLASLPRAFGTKLDTIPIATPYLRPSTDALLSWEMRLGAKKRPRIGVAWAPPSIPSPASGGGWGGGDGGRSIALKALLPLFTVDATFVRLQKDLRPSDEAQLRSLRELFDPIEFVGDYADYAALLSRLDLVISVDADAAHLAGALGKPVWILLAFTPDWPWQLNRNTTPWYPTARLYRQARPGDWHEVVARIAADLPSVVARDAPPSRSAV